MIHGEEVATPAATPAAAVLRRWPTWLGIGLAAWVALDLSEGDDLGPGLVAMAVVYLAAAALGRPAAAWAVFPATFLIVLTSQELASDAVAMWLQIGLAVAFVAYAVARGAGRGDDRTFTRQAVAMVGFAAVAGAALAVGDDAGAYAIAAGLFGHAVWDAYHHRRNEAVARSYAEFCSVLDVLVAVAVVVVTVGG